MSICIYICNVYVISIHLIFLPPPTAMRIKDTPKTCGNFWAPPAAVASLPATTGESQVWGRTHRKLAQARLHTFLQSPHCCDVISCDFCAIQESPGVFTSTIHVRAFLALWFTKTHVKAWKGTMSPMSSRLLKTSIKMGEPASHSAGPFWWSFLLRPFHLIGMWVKSGHPKWIIRQNQPLLSRLLSLLTHHLRAPHLYKQRTCFQNMYTVYFCAISPFHEPCLKSFLLNHKPNASTTLW